MKFNISQWQIQDLSDCRTQNTKGDVVNFSQKRLKINKIMVGLPGNPLNAQLLHM